MTLRRASFVLCLLASLTACGKRGDPRPPIPVIPQATSDLVVAQRGSRLILTWSFPAMTTAGKSLTEIDRIVVYRYVEPLSVDHVGAPPRDPNATVAERFVAVPPLSPSQFARLNEKVDSIEGANLAAATVGSRLAFEDNPPIRSADGRPVRLTYGVVTEGKVANSPLSNLAVIVPADVPFPPAGLAAAPSAEGVTVTWDKPAQTITGATVGSIAGYNIYRTAAGEAFDAQVRPLNIAPVAEAKFIDKPTYGEYEYRVTAVAADGSLRVESEPSAPVKATFRDVVPPPPPQNVTVLVETKDIRLLWDAPENAPDLAGYNVYRWEQKARLKLTLGLLTSPNFLDVNVMIGITYRYEVTSVDRSGNESAPTATNEVMVAKTP